MSLRHCAPQNGLNGSSVFTSSLLMTVVFVSFIACDISRVVFSCVDFGSEMFVFFFFSLQLTKTKEHGKLNPRPGKVTLVLFVNLFVK